MPDCLRVATVNSDRLHIYQFISLARDQSRGDLDRPARASALEDRLQREHDVYRFLGRGPDFVEEKRAAVALLEFSDALRQRASANTRAGRSPASRRTRLIG